MSVRALSRPSRGPGATLSQAAFLSTLVCATLICVSSTSAQDDTPAPYDAVLVAPSELVGGGRSSATVTVFRSDGAPPASLPVFVYLMHDGAEEALLGSATTDASGQANVAFEVPPAASGSYGLRAVVAGVNEPLEATVDLTSAPALLIETDKPIYKPGQTIQGRVVLLDNAMRPRAGDVEVTIFDAKSIRVARRNLQADSFGVAPFSLDLASEANFGVWKIRAESDGRSSSRDVRVENYVLPRFDLVAQFPRSWTLPDESIHGTIRARYFFGKPVAGDVEVRAQRYVGDWETWATAEGSLEDGEFSFEIPEVGFVAGTPGNGGLGTVTFEVSVVDSTGHRQKTTEVLTVAPAPTVVQLVPQLATLKPGMPAHLLVVTESPDGEPRDATVQLSARSFDLWGGFQNETQHEVQTLDGTAEFSVTPAEGVGRMTFDASVRTDEEHVSRTELTLSSTYSPSSNFLSLYREGPNRAAQVGEELRFGVATTTPSSVFYEVFAGGRTVFSDSTRSETIRFTVTPEMAPAARLVAYAIQDNNEISADTLDFDVEVPSTVDLSATLSRDELRPGETVTLAIDAGVESVVGVSLVDCSVLALGRGRLHLGEVFSELERRFMEPVGAVVGGEGGEEPVGGRPAGGAPPIDDGIGDRGFWGPSVAPGAREILEKAGLTVVATDGVLIPERHDMFDAVADGPVPEAGGGGDDRDQDLSPTAPPVRVRQFFPETWLWAPDLQTDENGLATLELTVPDSITCWELTAVGTSRQGLGIGEGKATVFQEFFVEPSLPVAVTRGEEFPISVQIFNYLDVSQTVDLEFGAGDWYELVGDATQTVEVPANSAISAHFPIRPLEVGDHEVRVVAIGSELSDAVVRFLTVEPEGHPVEEVDNSVIVAGDTVALDTTIPAHAVPDSGRAYLNITPSPISQTLQGISNLLNMPFGCGEQNMIFLAPDVEILRYLDATGEVMPAVRALAEHFVNVGYQRELTFQTTDGGFAAFGGDEGSLWLTAFVLSTFSVARDVRDIDENVLRQSAAMLAGRQKPDGSFQTDDFLIHQEMDGGLSNVYAMAAYVASALADYLRPDTGTVDDVAQTALDGAAQYLAAQQTSVDDAYSLSIAAAAMAKIPGREDEADTLVDRLLDMAIREGVGMHWEPYPIESTGYATLALLARSRPEAASAVDWLTTQRNALGGYGESTQDTVVAVRALTEAALKVRADLDLDLDVLQGEAVLSTFRVDESNYDILQSVELPTSGGAVSLAARGEGSVAYQVARRYNVPLDFLPPPSDLRFSVRYDAQDIEVDEEVDVHVSVTYTGVKEKTAMAIVDVGVPTGFAPVGPTLDAVRDSGVASRVEVAGRKVLFYLDELVRDQTVSFAFRVRALFPVRAEGQVSRAYAYYDSSIHATVRGEDLVVAPVSADGTFVRGDANVDRNVDITDAIAILTYMFLDASGPDCLDRLDVDDNGQVELTDPIWLLEHLFLGGATPRPPFPVAGTDPTPDELRCGDS